MELQKDSQVNFKNEGGIKGYFKEHKYQKFMIVGGLVAAAAETFGIHNSLTSVVTFAGVAAGALAISNMVNPEARVKTSAFLALGGVVLGAVTNILPFETILDQGTSAVFAAGIVGLAYAGYNKMTGKQVKM